jgi:hypothetical protein
MVAARRLVTRHAMAAGRCPDSHRALATSSACYRISWPGRRHVICSEPPAVIPRSQAIPKGRRRRSRLRPSGGVMPDAMPMDGVSPDADLRCGHGLNVMIARLIPLRPVPLFGASGQHQPVHADDLAAACVAALGGRRPSTPRPDGNLTYREMVKRIFAAEGRTPRFLPVHFAWRCGVSRIALQGFHAEMARRMNRSGVRIRDAKATSALPQFEPLRPGLGEP